MIYAVIKKRNIEFIVYDIKYLGTISIKNINIYVFFLFTQRPNRSHIKVI